MAVLCIVPSVQHAFSQEKPLIDGVIVDSATLKPLPYVHVVVKNKGTGTQSDAEGKFSLRADYSDTLILSYVGYRRLELPLYGWESSLIRMAEIPFLLESVTLEDYREIPYENLFDEENARLEKQNKKLPFYYSKEKKEKIKISRFDNENLRVKTYVETVVINNKLKDYLMEKHKIDENEYYSLLAKFNEENYRVMYYLSASELLSLIYRFFDANAKR